MPIWNRIAAHFGPQADLLGFAPTGTPDADAWLAAFTDDFMQHANAAHATDALMSGLRFYTPEFVAALAALPPVAARRPPIAGRIPRAIYATTGPIIVAVYQNVISQNAGNEAIRAAFMQAMPGLLSQNNYVMH